MTLLKQCDGCGRWLHDPLSHTDCTGDRPARFMRPTPWNPDLDVPVVDEVERVFPPGPMVDRWADLDEPRVGTKAEEQ